MAADRRVFFGDPSGMNLDVDPRLVPNGQTLKRRNVSPVINGNQLVLSNIPGNYEIEHTLPDGSNSCIGSFDDKLNKAVYAFIWNSENNHSITRWNYHISVNTVTELVQGEGLAFYFDYLISSVEIINNELLVWTDAINQICALNLTDYASLPSPLTTADRHYIELAKKPNPDGMSLNIGTVYSAQINHIKNKVFKFRSVNIYPLYLRTVGSTITQVAIPKTVPYDLEDTVIRDNVIYLDVPVPEYDDVQKVELLVQFGETNLTMGNWYKFAEIDPADLPATVMYDGTQPLVAADQTEMLQPYSFVPPTCDCLVFLPNNSLGFGSPTENIDANITPQVAVTPVYNARPAAGAATTTCVYSNSNTGTSGTFKNINFDIEISSSPTYDTLTIGGVAKVGDFINISLTMTRSGTVPSGLTGTTTVASITYTVSASDTLATIAQNITKLLNCADTRPSGFGGIVAYYPGSGSVVRLIQGLNNNAAPYTPSTVVSAASVSVTNDGAYAIAETKPNLKRYDWHEWGIGYADAQGRLTPVIPCTKFFSEGYDATTNDGWVSAQMTIMHEAPSAATDWYLYYLEQTPLFLQIWCNAFQVIDIVFSDGVGSRPPTGSTINDTTAGETIVVVEYLDGNSTYGTMRAYVSGTVSAADVLDYNTSSWTGIIQSVGTNEFTAIDLGDRITYDIENYGTNAQDWAYLAGDQLRFIAVNNGGTFTYFSAIPNLNIVDGNEQWLYVSFDLTTLTPSVAYPSSVLVEIWRPNTNELPRIWYQTGIKGTVFESGGAYYHTGTTQNQSASQGAISAVTNFGNTYSRYSPNPVGFATIASDLIESLDMTPFVRSQVTSIGKPAVEDDLSLVPVKRNGIYHSQTFQAQTELNGLSVVLGSSYKDYANPYGYIQRMWVRDFVLVVFFEDRVGRVGINRELILQPSGTQTYQTNAVLNSMDYYEYEGGISNDRSSLATNEGVAYWVDSKRNKILRLANNGIFPISNYGIKKWVNDNLDVKTIYSEYRTLIGVYDERNDSYVLVYKAFREFSGTTVTSPPFLSETTITGLTTQEVLDIIAAINSGGALIQIVSDIGYRYVNGTAESLTIGEVTITFENVVSGSSPVGGVHDVYIELSKDVLVFNEPSNAWTTFLDLPAEMISGAGVDWVSFNSGAMYLQNQGILSDGTDNYNTFYGSVVESFVDIPFNLNYQTYKTFINLRQEATDVWISDDQGDVYTLEGMESLLQANHYTELLRGRWSAAILKDMNTPVTVAPTYPLFEGYDMAGAILIMRFKTSNVTQNLLSAVTVNSVDVNI